MRKLIYGKVTLFQERCPSCNEKCLSGIPEFECTICNLKFNENIIKETKIIVAQKRKPISKKIKREIIYRQGNKCYWCNNSFDNYYKRNNKVIKFKIHIDHVIPFSFVRNDCKDNLVASCNICNNFKSNRHFNNDIEIKNYIQKKWNKELAKNKISVICL